MSLPSPAWPTHSAWASGDGCPRIMLGGFIGAALGTVTYELLGATVFPAAQTTQFVSATWATRLFARLAVTIASSAGVALAASESRKHAAVPGT